MDFGLISHEVLETAESFFVTGFKQIGQYLISNPAVAIFICLALGYLIGKIRIKSFSVGATVGTLLSGILLSLALSSVGSFKIDGLVKTIFFSLFIFTIGYEVGPSFFTSLKHSGLKIVGLSLFFIVVAFGIGYALLKLTNATPGEAGGILAGAITQSAILGTADAALKNLLSGDALADAESQMAIAYALTYVIGTVGVVVLMKNVAPALLGVKLKDATQTKIAQTGFKEGSGNGGVISQIKARAFKLAGDCVLNGQTVESVEEQYGHALSIEALFRGDKPVKLEAATVLQADDILTVIGNVDAVAKLESEPVEEMTQPTYLSLKLTKGEIVLKKGFDPHAIDALLDNGLLAMDKGNQPADLAKLKAGDTVTMTGSKAMLAKAAKLLGYQKDAGDATDVSFLSIGVVAGLVLGALCLTVSGIPITLGAGGGALVAGLLFGWYQDKHQNHGRLHASTRWFLKSVGLNLFIAIVGLMAGGKFLSALQAMGWQVLAVGAAITIVPHILTMLFGRYVMKMDAVDIIGTQCGAGTCTAALNGVIEETGSSIFAMSYTPGYAVGNILLTVLGPIIVSLLI